MMDTKAITMLKYLVGEIKKGYIEIGNPLTYIPYSKVHRDLKLEIIGNTVSKSLERQGLGDLALWIKENGYPVITGLIISKQKYIPLTGYFNVYGKGEFDIDWWKEEIGRSLEFDWDSVIKRFTKTELNEEDNKLNSKYRESVNKILVKHVGKSQYKYGVRINKEFHKIFNPSNSKYYTARGSRRKIKVDFNNKEFDAYYVFENQRNKNLVLQRISFNKVLTDEFKTVFPEPIGRFTIKVGNDLNYFIFNILEDRNDTNLTNTSYNTLDELNAHIYKQITKSKSDSQEERRKRIDKANPKPVVISVKTTAYKRNADVIVEVLERAKGNCERCSNPAPFIRESDGTHYLEVHHKIPLSEGGEDTVENAIALCPNCHREMHYGIKKR